MSLRTTVLASAARTASGTGPVLDLFGEPGGGIEFHAATYQLVVSAVLGTLPTLDVFVQIEMPDGSYTDLVAFTRMSAVGKRVAVVFPSAEAVTEAPLTDAVLTLGSVIRIPLGPRYRVKWVIAGTAGPSFTFSVLADMYGSSEGI